MRRPWKASKPTKPTKPTKPEDEQGPKGPLAEQEAEVRRAERGVTIGTWIIAAGMVVYSMITGTAFVQRHTAEGWEWSAPVLPLVVDVAFLIALKADEVASRLGGKSKGWPVLLRWTTGLSSVFLNVWLYVEKADPTGVAVHVIPSLLMVIAAEAGPAYRRTLGARLRALRAEAEAAEERERERDRAEADLAEQKRREEEKHRAALAREEEERQREVRAAEEQRKFDLERQRAHLEGEREDRKARNDLERQRLVLEAQRLERQQPAPAQQPERPAPAEPRPEPQRERTPEPPQASRPVEQPRPEPVLAAAEPQRPAVHARLDAPAPQPAPEPAPEPEPVGDIEQQIEQAFRQGWTTRATGQHVGLSATTISKRFRALEDAGIPRN